MKRRRFTALFVPFLGLALMNQPAHAAFHLWQVREVFTNSDGSVQFIEMFDSFGGETAVNGFALTSNSDGVVKTFTFPSNLTRNTPGALLIATTGFGSLPGGVTPDFTFSQSTTPISGSFFNPNATNFTIRFSGSSDVMTFTGAALPKDGVKSLSDAGAVGFPPGTPNISAGTNSPTNLLGNAGSVNLAPPPEPTGDYNHNGTVDAADYTVWRNTFGQGVDEGTGADGDGDGTIGDGDYVFWKSRFGDVVDPGGAGSAAAVMIPEPAVLTLAVSGTWVLAIAVCRRRKWGSSP